MGVLKNVEGMGDITYEGTEPSHELMQSIYEEQQRRAQEQQVRDEYEGVPGIEAGPDIERARELPPPTPEALIEEYTGMSGWNRDAFTMGGATAGEVIGTGGGLAAGLATPIPGDEALLAIGGNRLGATLGAGAGSAAYDALEAAIRSSAGLGPKYDDPLAPAKIAGKEMAYEATGQSIVKAIEPVLAAGKRLSRWALGTEKASSNDPSLVKPIWDKGKQGWRWLKKTVTGSTPEQKQLAKEMDEHAAELSALGTQYGVPMGIVQSTKRGGMKGVTRVLGVIPWVGGPFKHSVQSVDAAMGKMYKDLLDSFAPQMTMARLGVDYTEAAAKRFERYSKTSGILYDKFNKLVKSLPADKQNIIPTTNMRKAAQLILDKTEPVIKATGEPQAQIVPDHIRKYAQELVDFPGRITPDEYMNQVRGLKELLGNVKTTDMNGAALKEAMEADFGSPVLNFAGEKGPAIQKALEKANWFYGEGLKKFETTQGKKFGRVNRNLFSASFDVAGPQHSDEIFATIFNSKSAEGLAELRKLVGPEHFKHGARTYIEEAFKKSIDTKKGLLKGMNVEHVNLQKLAKQMGLGDEQGEAILGEMLKGTGVSVKDWKNFIKLGEAANSFALPSASVFLQRRVTLGGLGALATASKAGQASVLDGMVAIALMRKGAKFLSDPGTLKAVMSGLDRSATKTAKRNAILRVGRLLVEDDPADPYNQLPPLTPEDIEGEYHSNLPEGVKALQASVAAGSSDLHTRIQAAIAS